MPKQGQVDNNYPALLERENKIKLLEPFKGSKKHHNMECMVCGHRWSATPISKRQTLKKNGVSGCPACNEIRRNEKFNQQRALNLQSLEDRGIQILDDSYDGRRHIIDHNTYTKIKVKNLKCGHVFECSPSNLLSRTVECAVCGPQKRVEPLTKWSKQNSKKWKETASDWKIYKSEVTALTNKNYRSYRKQINPLNLPRGRASVDGAYHLDHIVPIRFCFENNIPPEVCADITNLQMLKWTDNVGSRCNIKGSIPHVFIKYLSESYISQHATDTIKQALTNDCVENYTLNEHNISIYDPNFKVAVVILPVSKPFSNQKTGKLLYNSCQRTDIKLFVIFEDEILNNPQLVKNKLKHYCHRNKAVTIHGRKCIIKQIDSQQKSKFLNQFHIQGNDNSQIKYGAFYNDHLVAVMTFTAPRVALGYKNKDRSSYIGKWELSRFATDTSYRIPGIASKLLKHFQNNNKWDQIISYADARWSTGNLYDVLGFELQKHNPPDYFYIIDGQRKHRWNYRKDILKNKLPNYDPTLTEYQNMENHGFWRVWDCGTLRYVLQNNK